MKIVFMLLAILLLILLLVKMPPPMVPSTHQEPYGAEIESVADVAMLSGACGMRPPQLE